MAQELTEIFYHGTKANLNHGDLIEPGFNSNYGSRRKALYVISLPHSKRPRGARNLLWAKGAEEFISWSQPARLKMTPT